MNQQMMCNAPVEYSRKAKLVKEFKLLKLDYDNIGKFVEVILTWKLIF